MGPTICLREDTISALWEQLQQVGVIHARGTPTSGKSTMAALLDKYIQERHKNMEVYRFSWPPELPKSYEMLPYHSILNALLGLPDTGLDIWEYKKNALLIIDEAQQSYKCASLWNDFIKICAQSETPRWRPYIILFSSYGSPSAKPAQDNPLATSAPTQLSTKQRVSIKPFPGKTNPNVSLYFTRAEFDDVVERHCKFRGQQGQKFLLSLEVLEYLWLFTSGHPGAVSALLTVLANAKVC